MRIDRRKDMDKFKRFLGIATYTILALAVIGIYIGLGIHLYQEFGALVASIYAVVALIIGTNFVFNVILD
jgi:hypothetical protein